MIMDGGIHSFAGLVETYKWQEKQRLVDFSSFLVLSSILGY